MFFHLICKNLNKFLEHLFYYSYTYYLQLHHWRLQGSLNPKVWQFWMYYTCFSNLIECDFIIRIFGLSPRQVLKTPDKALGQQSTDYFLICLKWNWLDSLNKFQRERINIAQFKPYVLKQIYLKLSLDLPVVPFPPAGPG